MLAQVPSGVTDVLATLSVVSLVIERIIEFVVAQAFPDKPAAFLGPATNSRRLVTFGLAVALGIIVVSQANLGLLVRLNPTASHGFDVFFTGLLLAAGTQPIHSILRLLDQRKDAANQPARGK